MYLLGLIEIPLWLLIVLAIVVATYIHYVYVFQQFKRQGLKGATPWPLVGTMFSDFAIDIYDWPSLVQKFGKVFGAFMGPSPMIWVCDPEMVKQIAVKDFNKFPNHMTVGCKEPPLGSIITMLTDDHWRHVRNHITPAFSSGKMKRMAAHISNASQQLVDQIGKHVEKGEEFDFKKPAGNFAMDVIAGTVFGLQVDSQNNPDDPFAKYASKLGGKSLNLAGLIAVFAPFLSPYAHKAGIRFIPKEVTDFFLDIITRTKEDRKEKKGGQLDFIQMMADAEIETEPDTQITQDEQEDKDNATQAMEGEWTRKGLTTEEILAQSLGFFLAGYDNTGNTLGLLLHHLALDQASQERAREEVMEVIGDNEQIEYDDVSKMTYLHQCLQESLRLFPPQPVLDRVCKEECDINGVHFPKGMTVILGIYNIHMDPQLYPDPKKFDPDRFSAETVAARHSYSWLPFGTGPRNCIGMRLVMMQIKMAAAALLKNYKFMPCEKTQDPPKLKSMQMFPADGIWVKASPVQ